MKLVLRGPPPKHRDTHFFSRKWYFWRTETQLFWPLFDQLQYYDKFFRFCYSLMVSPIIIFKQAPSRYEWHIALRSCLEEGPIWASPVPSECSVSGYCMAQLPALTVLACICSGSAVEQFGSMLPDGDPALRVGCQLDPSDGPSEETRAKESLPHRPHNWFQ